MPSTNQPEVAQYNDYSDYHQDNHYTYDTGLLALPVAGAESAVKIIRLHGGYGTRKLDFNMSRQGRPPIVPTMVDTPNDTFLGGSLGCALPSASQNSQGYTWTVGGEYTFIQTTPRIVGLNTFPVGTYPGSMTTQDLGALGQGGDDAVPPYESMTLENYDNFWNGIAASTVDIPSGTWTWPFLAFPPIFSTDLALSN